LKRPDKMMENSEESSELRPDPLECLKGLEPLSSFECSSGVLLWGQLDTVMEAKLNLDDGKFDGWAAQADQGGAGGGTVYMRGHRFKCRAAKGKWTKYLTKVDDELFGFYCHEDSLSPFDLVKHSMHVGFSWDPPNPEVTRVVYVNRYDWAWHLHQTVFGPEWKPSGFQFGLEVILTDPSWDMKLPPLPDEDEKKKQEVESDNREGPTPEEYLKRLEARYSSQDEKTFILENNKEEACGLLSTDFNDHEYLCARLVFNGDKELIGMGFNDLGDNNFYHNTEYCSHFHCASSKKVAMK